MFHDLHYRSAVKTLFKNESNHVFSNRQPEHIAQFYEMLFRNAQTSVRVVCNDLEKDLFSHSYVYAALEDGLRKGIEVFILAVNYDKNTAIPERLSILSENYSGLTVRVLEPKPQLDKIKFAVMDRIAYRFENTKNPGVACMHDHENAQTLMEIFTKLAYLTPVAV